MTDPKNIVLIGMPASGKSTIGVLLAKEQGFPFIDTDIVIQTREGRKLSQIISEKGLAAFCKIEEEHVLGVTCMGHVIATGGSVVYGDCAMKHLKSMGTVIHLDISLEELTQRLGDLNARGVVISEGQTFEELYHERQTLYRKYADLTVDTSSSTPNQVLHAIVQALKTKKN